MGCCALLLTGGKCTLFISPLQRETKQTIAVCVSPESTKKLNMKKKHFSSPVKRCIKTSFVCAECHWQECHSRPIFIAATSESAIYLNFVKNCAKLCNSMGGGEGVLQLLSAARVHLNYFASIPIANFHRRAIPFFFIANV